MKRSIIHIDMDAFYASIEQNDYPEYRNKPIAVGGSPDKRGVVCTASYEARKFGVRSAMSSKVAQKLCPNLIIVPVRMNRYIDISKQIQEIFKRYSTLVESLSIDEAFLDVSGSNPIQIGLDIKKEIKLDTGLSASIGISYNKYLAKLASDFNKPDGFKVIYEKEAKAFLDPLPIRKLWGVGPKTEKQFNQLGIFKISDLLCFDKSIILKIIGKKGLELIDFAEGKDERCVENTIRRKSFGGENTFDYDIGDISVVRSYLLEYCKEISSNIIENKLRVKTITLKIKYEDFSCITRSVSLPYYVNSFSDIFKTADNILSNKISMNKKIRLLGIQVSNILYPDEPMQLEIQL